MPVIPLAELQTQLRSRYTAALVSRWQRPGRPALHLSTFLGHVNPASTAVYLTITSDLLQFAGERFGRFALPLSTGGTP